MLKVGLTGGVACGKTTIMRLFAARGAHIMFADEVAHDLMRPGHSVYEAVVERFGREILNADGIINRPRLAALAFPGRIKELNALVHPAVIAFQDRWMQEIGERDPHAIAIVEAALLVEAGAHTHFDKVIAVVCDLGQKVRRFAERQQLSLNEAAEEVRRRMAAQISDVEKAHVADYVIDNSGTVQQAETQVARIWQELTMAKAAGHEPA
ncbi:MAG TPA: dephospho-CoA kinase [Clostridia bacterium]|nr:dephospho-CoA kinase [Clostridia bacterium]